MTGDLAKRPSAMRAPKHIILGPWEKLQTGVPEGGNLAKVLYKLQSEAQKQKGANGAGQFLNLQIKGCQNGLEEGDVELLAKVLTKNDSAEILCLSHQSTPLDTVALGKYVSRSRGLRVLDISYSDVQQLKPLINSIQPCTTGEYESEQGDVAGGVQYLNLGGIPIDFETMGYLVEKLRANKSIEALKLNSCDLKIDAIIKLLNEGLPNNTTLKSLDISRADRINNPYNVSVHLQRYFANNTHTISRLVLNHLNLDDQCMRNVMLGVLRSENNLKYLDVASNKFSRDAAKPIVELVNKSKIQSINLSFNRLEDPGCSDIIKSLARNTALETLIIKSCEASEPTWLQAKQTFAKNKSLAEFFVWGNDFKGQAGAQALTDLISENRFARGMGIDLEPYQVDGVIYMAEDGDHAIAAINRFHWMSDDKAQVQN